MTSVTMSSVSESIRSDSTKAAGLCGSMMVAPFGLEGTVASALLATSKAGYSVVPVLLGLGKTGAYSMWTMRPNLSKPKRLGKSLGPDFGREMDLHATKPKDSPDRPVRSGSPNLSPAAAEYSEIAGVSTSSNQLRLCSIRGVVRLEYANIQRLQLMSG